jgi:hypothetical protein
MNAVIGRWTLSKLSIAYRYRRMYSRSRSSDDLNGGVLASTVAGE